MSILVHVALILFLALTPGWFDTTPRRVLRIAGEDFDVAKLQLTPLVLPQRLPTPRAPAPAPEPAPAQQPPPVQIPQQAAPPPPPPPPQPKPQPPPPQPPDRVIRPDDLLVEGARPDGSTKASRGDTREQAKAGGAKEQEAQEAQAAQAAQEAKRAQEARQAQQLAANQANNGSRVLPNLNSDALRSPSLMSSADKIVEATLASAAKSGSSGSVGRTGIARSNNLGSYATTDAQILSPNPKGIDFGPYLNGLLTRLRTNWFSVMPEIARLGQKGRVDIVFTVARNGEVKDLQVVANSGYEALDKGALSAIQLSNPFQKLPAEYETDLKLRIAFLYNMYP